MRKLQASTILKISGSVLFVLLVLIKGQQATAPVTASEIIQDSLYSQANFPKAAAMDSLKRNEQEDSWINSLYADRIKQNAPLTTHPFFRLVNVDKKQTLYQLSADLSYAQDIKTAEFVGWGDPQQADLQKYPAVYDPLTATKKAQVPIVNHKVAGRYQVRLLITKTDGRIKNLLVGEFEVDQPKVSTTLDASRTAKGQFDVTVRADSAAEVENLEVPVWSRADRSDLKVYTGQRQDKTTYKIRMDYEDFDFRNGVYHAQAFLTSQNGLSAESDRKEAEIQLSLPKRVRILQEATIYQNRALTEEAQLLERNTTVKVEGVVYNEEQKIFKTKEGYLPAENLAVREKSEAVQYVSHRGNSRVAPENSLPAFQQATTWGVEADARLTLDRQWVIMHDDSVDRMTNGTGVINQLTLAEINELRIDHGKNIEAYDQTQLRVPTLEAYLAEVQAQQKVPVIDLKPADMTGADYDSLANLITTYGFGETGMVISFDYSHLQEIKQRLPNIHVQLLSDELNEQLITDVYDLGSNAGLDIRYDSLVFQADLITQAQDYGLAVNAWTIPKKEWRNAEKLGIDFITAKTGPKKKA